jgi:pSer/pThr/pTyr-binding forkhead associated (FHA) protein
MSVTAFTCLPDPRPSRLNRIGQLRNYTQNRSLSSRFPWRSSTSGASSPNPVENSNTSSTPCPDTDHPALSRYTSAPSESSGFGDLTSRVSSADSAVSTQSNEAPQTTTHVMARLRSASAAQHPPPRTQDRQNSESSASPEPNSLQTDGIAPTSVPEDSITSPKPDKKATIRFFPYQDSHASSSTRPSLPFVPIARTLPSESCVIRVGRYSERDGIPVPNPTEPSDAPVGFKSKVVSRKHCEFLYVNGQWHIKDVGSSSGTFLNHMRLSQPNMVSRLYSIKDGDIVQLGIDFRGGEEMIFRCVRIRIECNRSWQQQPNEFKYDDSPAVVYMMLTQTPAKIRKAS